ncbi:uncharacterized protein LOC110349649, partial [Heterocephalus glaber]|uniref:Uncharacterized protein LOC110349649 n=1 Tax=Heterocephalus glaber TaxID=10181 RepID=A0AAX6T5J0_HETGA
MLMRGGAGGGAGGGAASRPRVPGRAAGGGAIRPRRRAVAAPERVSGGVGGHREHRRGPRVLSQCPPLTRSPPSTTAAPPQLRLLPGQAGHGARLLPRPPDRHRRDLSFGAPHTAAPRRSPLGTAPPPAATPCGPLSPPPVTGSAEAASPCAAAASSSSPRPAVQDAPPRGLTGQQPATAGRLPSRQPGGGGANTGVTHLLPSQDFKPRLHLPSSSSASRGCCRTSSPQDFSERRQQQLSSQKRDACGSPRRPHPPDPPPPR